MNKIVLDAAELRRAMKFIEPAVMRNRRGIPILSCVLVQWSEHNLRLTSTDMDRVLWISPDTLELVGSASFAIDHRNLSGLLRDARGAVTLSFEEGKLKSTGGWDPVTLALVECDGLSATLPTLPAEDFPILTAESSPDQQIPWVDASQGEGAKALAAALRRVRVAASRFAPWPSLSTRKAIPKNGDATSTVSRNVPPS